MAARSLRSTASNDMRGPVRRKKGRLLRRRPRAPGADRQSRILASKEGTLSLNQAKETAYRLLSYRDRSSKEIVLKLEEKGFAEGMIVETLSFLREAGYLDDVRFARQWAQSRMERRRLGPIRLKGELLEKGIPSDLIEEVLSGLSDQWAPLALAGQALLQRFPDPAPLQNLKIRKKAFVFLQRKGFSAETILTLFRKMERP